MRILRTEERAKCGSRMERESQVEIASVFYEEYVNLRHAAAFVYRDSMQREMQNKCEVILSDVDLLYMSTEKECADDNKSKSTVTVKLTGVRNQNIATDIWPVYTIDTPIEED